MINRASPYNRHMLRADNLPLQLYHKAKTLMWDPRAIDLTQDARDWQQLSHEERDILLRLAAQFLQGEEAVTHDLTPLLLVLRRQGDLLEEEMFLTTQLFEESKHVEWFARWFDEVAQASPPAVESSAYRALFMHELPRALDRLLHDASPHAQVEAIATYHLIVEGVLAETGYRGYARALGERGLLPGTTHAIALVQRDESRHIAYGLHALTRLCRADAALWEALMARLNHLLPLALEIVRDTFAPYGDAVPFGLDPAEFVTYASDQFDHRLRVLERELALA